VLWFSALHRAILCCFLLIWISYALLVRYSSAGAFGFALLVVDLEKAFGAFVFELGGPGLSLWLCGSQFIAKSF